MKNAPAVRSTGGETESVALNMPCAHIRSRRSWLRAYALALICRPSASSAAPQALQGSISFSCVTGGSHLRLRLDEPPPATFCRPPDSQIRLAALAIFERVNANKCPPLLELSLPMKRGRITLYSSKIRMKEAKSTVKLRRDYPFALLINIPPSNFFIL